MLRNTIFFKNKFRKINDFILSSAIKSNFDFSILINNIRSSIVLTEKILNYEGS